MNLYGLPNEGVNVTSAPKGLRWPSYYPGDGVTSTGTLNPISGFIITLYDVGLTKANALSTLYVPGPGFSFGFSGLTVPNVIFLSLVSPNGFGS
jgi:hypothetical protein